MDDDTLHSGPSGWAWFQLGRMAAETERHTSETVRKLLRPRQPTVDVNGVLTQNQALAAENAQLRRDLDAYKHNYSKLRTWAEEAKRDLDRLQRSAD